MNIYDLATEVVRSAPGEDTTEYVLSLCVLDGTIVSVCADELVRYLDSLPPINAHERRLRDRLVVAIKRYKQTIHRVDSL